MFKENPRILFFFQSKMDATLSSTDVKFLLNQRRKARLSASLFYEPRSRYLLNQSGSAKRLQKKKFLPAGDS